MFDDKKKKVIIYIIYRHSDFSNMFHKQLTKDFLI